MSHAMTLPKDASAAPAPPILLRDDDRMRRCAIAPALEAWYRVPRIKRFAISAMRRLEGGQMHSLTLRRVLERHHGVVVGAYSYGECCEPGVFPPGTTVGRFVSCATEVRVLHANHPIDRLSLHPYFYTPEFGYVEQDDTTYTNLTIESDAWIGGRAIITPGCRRIGLGAIVGGGAVVTRDVPDFAIVAGNPARVIRERFPDDVQERIRRSRWWERSITEIAQEVPAMVASLGDGRRHPLLRESGGSES